MIELRNVASWVDVPFEAIAALPPGAFEELARGIELRDPRIVQDRHSE